MAVDATRTRLPDRGLPADTRDMTAAVYVERLTKVQDELEALLAARPTDDLTAPAGYRSLVMMELVLLKQVKGAREPTGS
jgi:hypothetical protein